MGALDGKRIVVGVTGSISAIETPQLVRELKRNGAEVVCVMSKCAQNIIHPFTLQWASGRDVITEITGNVEHLRYLTEWGADLFLIAPATANTISKIACGIDDTQVTTFATVALASKIPLQILPTMEQSMYSHPILLENIEKLKKLGVLFIEPHLEENKAKFPSPEFVALEVIFALTKKDLLGKKILITGGATLEEIDPVRFLSNHSSGKLAVAFAQAAHLRGAVVTLLLGQRAVAPRYPLKTELFSSGNDLLHLLEKHVPSNDIIIHAAAVCDFTCKKKEQKIASDTLSSLSLERTPKLLDELKRLNPSAFVIGFKAETSVTNDALTELAYSTLKRSCADLVVANDVARVGFGTDKTEVLVVDSHKKTIFLSLAPKEEIAHKVLDLLQ